MSSESDREKYADGGTTEITHTEVTPLPHIPVRTAPEIPTRAAPAVTTDAPLHAQVRAPLPAEVKPSGVLHALLGDLDTRRIQHDDYRIAADARALGDRGVTIKEVTALLVSCGLKDAEAAKVISLARSLQKIHSGRNVYSELAAELRVAYFFSENYHLDSDSFDVEERRPTNRNLLWRMRRVVDIAEEFSTAKSEELRAAGVEIQDLFHRDARPVDGVSVLTRLDIARWLNGPYANVRKPEEIKKLLPKLDLDLAAELDPLDSPSSQLNLAAWSVLKADKLFCVMEEHENEKLARHTRLNYQPSDGGSPVILDFSIHQILPEQKSPFVGTAAELAAIVKTAKAPSKISPLFEGNSRSASCQGVTLEVIQSIRQVLTARESAAHA